MEDKNNTKALVGMILGLVSIIAWILPLIGYPVTICGIIFSAMGLKAEKKTQAIVGIILSIIFFLVTLLNSILGVILAMFL